jgi:hypothetical protein
MAEAAVGGVVAATAAEAGAAEIVETAETAGKKSLPDQKAASPSLGTALEPSLNILRDRRVPASRSLSCNISS